MAQLLQLPNVHMTPVLIANQIDWVPQASDQGAHARVLPEVQAWLQARQSQDQQWLKVHYSTRFVRRGKDLEHWWPQLWRTAQAQAQGGPMDVVSALHWQDEGEQMVVTLRNPASSSARGAQFLRTYWQKEEGQWRVVFEGPA
jgi:hypothetical protein